MKSNSAWRGQAQFLLLSSFYEECKICYPAQRWSNRFWEILQQVLKIHHIMYLLFLPQATLTMSCSIPWITFCHPCIEIITIPLPLRPVLSGENITQQTKRKKNSPGTSAMRPSCKEMREVRIFQTAGVSLRWPCVVHKWAQTTKTLPFSGSKHHLS